MRKRIWKLECSHQILMKSWAWLSTYSVTRQVLLLKTSWSLRGSLPVKSLTDQMILILSGTHLESQMSTFSTQPLTNVSKMKVIKIMKTLSLSSRHLVFVIQ